MNPVIDDYTLTFLFNAILVLGACVILGEIFRFIANRKRTILLTIFFVLSLLAVAKIFLHVASIIILVFGIVVVLALATVII